VTAADPAPPPGADSARPAGAGSVGLGGRLRGFATRRRAVLLGALVAVFALVVGYLAGLLTPRFSAPGENSPEAGFARDMSTHHAQAVEMAMIAWKKSTDPEVAQVAYDIATVQENQIGTMQSWLVDWHLSPTGSRPKMAWMPDGTKELLPDGRMPGMASDAELQQLENPTGTHLDILFCQLMLRHHLGGIHMASTIISLSHNQRVVDLATTMRNNQQAEVTNLRTKLDQLHAQPLPS
jgi:uncharacterized protein (DUF305 family)